MTKFPLFLLLILLSFDVYAFNESDDITTDTTDVVTLNANGYKNRLTNPDQTVKYADSALKLATQINYKNGVAESYRIKGIGEYYLNHPEAAIGFYFEAQKWYELAANDQGVAKVFNNIGNLYQMVDYEKALEYFEKANVIAEKHHDTQLIASLYMNIGNIYNRKTSYNQALKYYSLSYDLFKKLNNPVLLIQCMQDLGAIYYSLGEYRKAEELLTDANTKAKNMDLNASVAAINLTLTSLYLAENNFEQAGKYMQEGLSYSKLINNVKDIYDYKHLAYDLEFKRKDYKSALTYLYDIYKSDSTSTKSGASTKLNFTYKEEENKIEAELNRQHDEYSRVKFWSVTGMAGLLLVVTGLLVNSVKRKATTNSQLQELNNEISRQKDNLDRINHHLEEIIDERTKDLQVKNKKLSEYSSYLSHQIRGPIATLKGLLNLEKEGLVGKQECIAMMDKCVSEIDEKIIETSEMLHDPDVSGFN
jgi:tetratricopeptide (TPR) repeat protein